MASHSYIRHIFCSNLSQNLVDKPIEPLTIQGPAKSPFTAINKALTSSYTSIPALLHVFFPTLTLAQTSMEELFT